VAIKPKELISAPMMMMTAQVRHEDRPPEGPDPPRRAEEEVQSQEPQKRAGNRVDLEILFSKGPGHQAEAQHREQDERQPLRGKELICRVKPVRSAQDRLFLLNEFF
jgi:hypothetical protein